MRTTYVVTYDIRDPKRLRRVYRLMLGYGEHVQYSVFRCDLTSRELLELKGRLGEAIHGRALSAFASMGQRYEHEERRAIVI